MARGKLSLFHALQIDAGLDPVKDEDDEEATGVSGGSGRIVATMSRSESREDGIRSNNCTSVVIVVREYTSY